MLHPHGCDLDRFAEPEIVDDQQVDARETKRFTQRKHLLSIEPDAGAERRLRRVAIRGDCRFAFEGAAVGCEGRSSPAPSRLSPPGG